eukprot:3728636-Karenia_brevis.AAC.1
MFRLQLDAEKSASGKVRTQNMSFEWDSVWEAKVTIFHMFRLHLDAEKFASGTVRAQKLSLQWDSVWEAK